MPISRIQIGRHLQAGTGANEIIITGASGAQEYLAAPVGASTLVLTYDGAGNIGWSASGGSYIGDVSSHTAGGDLSMDDNNLSSVNSISFSDNGVDLTTWVVQEDDGATPGVLADALVFTNGSQSIAFTAAGQLYLPEYTTAFSGTVANLLAVTSAGAVVETGISPSAGDYLRFSGSTWAPTTDQRRWLLSVEEAVGTAIDVDVSTGAPEQVDFSAAADGVIDISAGIIGTGPQVTFGINIANFETFLETNISIDSLSDVDTSTASPTNGQVLMWDATPSVEAWIPTTLPTFNGFDVDDEGVRIGTVDDSSTIDFEGDRVEVTLSSGTFTVAVSSEFFVPSQVALPLDTAISTLAPGGSPVVLPNAAIIIPPEYDGYELQSFSVAYIADTGGDTIKVAVAVDGVIIGASANDATAGGSGYESFNFAAAGTVSAGEVYQLAVSNVDFTPGNAEGLVFALEMAPA